MPQGQNTYSRRTWVNNSRPYLEATNLNAMEAGIEKAHIYAPPAGGTTGQVLAKLSATNYDYHWVNPGTDAGWQIASSLGVRTSNTAAQNRSNIEAILNNSTKRIVLEPGDYLLDNSGTGVGGI